MRCKLSLSSQALIKQVQRSACAAYSATLQVTVEQQDFPWTSLGGFDSKCYAATVLQMGVRSLAVNAGHHVTAAGQGAEIALHNKVLLSAATCRIHPRHALTALSMQSVNQKLFKQFEIACILILSDVA